jgi:hypothetical protein
MKFKNKYTSQKGYIAFTSLLVISAITTTILISSVLISVTVAKNALSYKKGQETKISADGCLENAMLRLQLDNTYSGETLVVGNTSCSITVSGVGANKTVNIESVITGPPNYSKGIQAGVSVKGTGISITSYQQTF